MTSDSIFPKLLNTIDTSLSKKSIPLALFVLFLFYHLCKIPLQTAGVDSGYFLSISRDFYADGLLPLSELRTIYTPIGYFFFGLPFLLFSDATIVHFYYFNLLLVSITSLLFLFVLNNHNFKNKYWISLVFFLTISPLIYDIKLELIVLLFLVFAYFFSSKYLLKRNWVYLFSSGLMVGLSVLTKQYALLLWPMTLVFLFSYSYDNKRSYYKLFFHESLIFSLGVTFVLLLFFILYLVFLDVDTRYVMDQVWGKVYYDCLGLYGVRAVSNLFIAIKYYAKFAPYIFFIPFLAFYKSNRSNLFKYLGLLILFIASLFPYYFQIYPHYFYFGFIPVFLLSISIFQISRHGQYIFLIFLYPVMLNVFSIYVLKRDYSILELRKQNDTEFYDQIRKYVPAGSKGFVEGKKQVYFECGLKSVQSKNIGYDYVPSLCIDHLIADSTVNVNQFYYVGTDKNLTFSEYSRAYIGETANIEGFTPHYIYFFEKN